MIVLSSLKLEIDNFETERLNFLYRCHHMVLSRCSLPAFNATLAWHYPESDNGLLCGCVA